ncbi:MAG TPA: DUF1579 family protein [Actinomycetota bacterium]|nr:DUF1579 family protein [Actinomycetota bacterium]
MTDETQVQAPTPDPALRLFDRFVGTWTMEGSLVGSHEIDILGEATYRWLPGGFFFEQHVRLDFMGMRIDSLELIGYDPESGTFPSTVFSNLSPAPLPYRWELDGDDVKISVSYGPLDATFTSRFDERRRGVPRRLASQPRRRRVDQRAVRHRWTAGGVTRIEGRC